MNILITGGNGVIGKQLAEELVRRGHLVTAVDLVHRGDEFAFSISSRTNKARMKFVYMRCDVSEFRQLQRVIETCNDFDIVYHTAAEFGRWNGRDFFEQLWKTNVIGTNHIIQLQQEWGFKLVHFSSSEVYGDYPSLMVESVMDQYEVKQLNDYAMTKWVNEMQIRNAITEYRNLQTVVVRLFNTYGPGEYYSPYRSVNCRFLFSALKGIPWIVFRGHKRTSTFLPDTVRTLANIADNFHAGETYNIGGDVEHSIEDLSDAVLAVTGADPKLVRYADSEPMTTRFKHVDCTKAIRDLRHKNTVNLKEGLALTADWMRKVYDL